MNLNQMTKGAVALAVALTLNACTAEETVSKDDFDALALLSVASSVNTAASNARAQLELNGQYKGFTGNGTTSSSSRTISATNIGGTVSGTSVSDGTGFSVCSWIVAFDNDTNVMITQNPPRNGACFAGDTNKGKFFKEVWINGPTAGSYYTCTVNGAAAAATLSAALAVEDTANRTSPGTGGCGGFAWSRIEPGLN